MSLNQNDQAGRWLSGSSACHHASMRTRGWIPRIHSSAMRAWKPFCNPASGSGDRIPRASWLLRLALLISSGSDGKLCRNETGLAMGMTPDIQLGPPNTCTYTYMYTRPHMCKHAHTPMHNSHPCKHVLRHIHNTQAHAYAHVQT